MLPHNGFGRASPTAAEGHHPYAGQAQTLSVNNPILHRKYIHIHNYGVMRAKPHRGARVAFETNGNVALQAFQAEMERLHCTCRVSSTAFRKLGSRCPTRGCARAAYTRGCTIDGPVRVTTKRGGSLKEQAQEEKQSHSL